MSEDKTSYTARTERIELRATHDERELLDAICETRSESPSDLIFSLLADYNQRKVYRIGSLIRELEDYRAAADAVARRPDDYGRQRVMGQYEGKVIVYDYVLTELRKLIQKT